MNKRDFLGDSEKPKTDAKYNLFGFQDHLTCWIYNSAEQFSRMDYISSFLTLTNVYTDSKGFFETKEKKEITKLFNKTTTAVDEYRNYIENHSKNRMIRQAWNPPKGLFQALLAFRTQLMEYMAEHELLIKRVRKSSEGAGEE